ncbi:SDR family NAD(P)-dependent oxidoreductase [Actinokineospora spheciospongiae]|uniref:SDR family NAD(P)-dependent oxidoreductase n=1 Tax=Actinokineospora spheciospongiae TaxID=909613 RepID=UPI000550632C|nr:SDR family NAD(P)-dependent oxidoreductase [Actinokineospora spheciospongiae]PWW63170.1 short-subunit dehydrogenase [Actinokineospora spheciospongiae]
MAEANVPTPLGVVTGASSGIGLELARQFAAHDIEVVLVAEDAAVHTAAEGLPRAHAVQLDLTRPEAVDELVRRVVEIGEPTALAINAGTAIGGAFVHDTSMADQLAGVDLNVRSAVQLAKALLPGMVDRGHGRVLFTSSVISVTPGPYQAVYNASKAFLKTFAGAIRTELKDTGVTVTTLMPGPTDTNFFAQADMLTTRLATSVPKDDPAKVAAQAFEAMMSGRARVIGGSPLNRLAYLSALLVPDRVMSGLHTWLSKPRPTA